MFADVCERVEDMTAPGILTIDLAALTRNYLDLAARMAPSRAAAVVKADAYGLGAHRVAPALYAAGCRDFFVAQFAEALALRPLLTSDARLYVLNGLLPGAEPACAAHGIIPVLNSLEQVANWRAVARRLGRSLPAALQVDSGMCRLGLAPEEVARLRGAPQMLEGLELLFVMSHLACADEPANEQNAEQLATFRQLAASFPDIGLCFANSGAIFLGSEFRTGLARPGIALYGGAPTGGAANPMAPVVRLDVHVVQTRTVPAGARIGYGGAHVTHRETRLATLAAGYADGLPRHLGDRGAAWFGETRLPIVGRVSMDSMTVDISALPPDTLKLGSPVEIIGPHQTLEDVATAAGTIAYEVLTRLGHRYHRIYR
ncbi:alanine racemase [Ancylobacter lacus]|uniref:alanine racemase n=1 Tax=Ancylobacter lacus TaxID=2579970 RepID=UPI001BCE9537|nr:alanine racemase [Ancylobacter lacus]MBS7539139.1 alanine racemase [Ancylobacter lacus]